MVNKVIQLKTKNPIRVIENLFSEAGKTEDKPKSKPEPKPQMDYKDDYLDGVLRSLGNDMLNNPEITRTWLIMRFLVHEKNEEILIKENEELEAKATKLENLLSSQRERE